jgi:hypothetical protein
MRCTEAADIIPWLLAAGLELETVDEFGRTPLLAMLHSAAPAETLRAMLDAGADVTATGEYDEQNVNELIDQFERTDLDFLREAWKAAGGDD